MKKTEPSGPVLKGCRRERVQRIPSWDEEACRRSLELWAYNEQQKLFSKLYPPGPRRVPYPKHKDLNNG